MSVSAEKYQGHLGATFAFNAPIEPHPKGFSVFVPCGKKKFHSWFIEHKFQNVVEEAPALPKPPETYRDPEGTVRTLAASWVKTAPEEDECKEATPDTEVICLYCHDSQKPHQLTIRDTAVSCHKGAFFSQDSPCVTDSATSHKEGRPTKRKVVPKTPPLAPPAAPPAPARRERCYTLCGAIAVVATGIFSFLAGRLSQDWFPRNTPSSWWNSNG